MPALTLSLEFAFAHHSAILGNEGNHELFLLASDETNVTGEIVASPFIDDAIPATIQQGVGIHHHMMGVICRKRLVGSQPDACRSIPGCQCMPPTVVLACIFKVAVLHEFCIETTIGSIADILKEHTDEFVADGLLSRSIYFQRSLYRCGQRCKTRGIVAHRLAIQLIFLRQSMEPLSDKVEVHLWHIKQIAFLHLAFLLAAWHNSHAVAQPSHVVDAA